MVGGLVFEHEALVALDCAERGGLLDGPLADVLPLLLGILLCVRDAPSVLPVVCELLEEGSLDCGGLAAGQYGFSANEELLLTVNVGFEMVDEVTDSITEPTDDVASLTPSSRSSTTSAREKAAQAPSARRALTRMVVA